jgi:tRNA(adenine34) deaminase
MHEKWMLEAFKEALKAQEIGEVPIGAVVVSSDGEIISRAHNLKESLSDPTGHAEILAIKAAGKALESWRLTQATLYVTLEPCMMCTGAIVQSRLRSVVYGAFDPKGGYISSLGKGLEVEGLNHRVEALGGVMEKECGEILTNFFKEKRKK